MQTNSKDFDALWRKQKFLVNVVKRRKVVRVYVGIVEDLSNGRYASSCRTLHFQLFPLNNVFAWKMGGVYCWDEDFVVSVLFVLKLKLIIFDLTL